MNYLDSDELISAVHHTLKTNGYISADKDVIVGLSVSTNGRFLVKRSLSQTPIMFDSFREALIYIVNN